MPLDGSYNPTTLWLIEGKKALLTHGWHPGPGTRGPNDSRCMMSALYPYGRDTAMTAAIQAILLKAILELGHENPGLVPIFNDATGRTLQEIFAVYDKAIEISTRN